MPPNMNTAEHSLSLHATLPPCLPLPLFVVQDTNVHAVFLLRHVPPRGTMPAAAAVAHGCSVPAVVRLAKIHADGTAPPPILSLKSAYPDPATYRYFSIMLI